MQDERNAIAQVEASGNVNISKFGARIPGVGGFVNITQSSKRVVFCGTMTAQGLEIAAEDGRLRIVQEGKIKKFVKKIEQVSFNARLALESGHEVFYVTERAVLALRPDGLCLTEIAPGMDLERDVLSQMEFRTRVEGPRHMDSDLFQRRGGT